MDRSISKHVFCFNPEDNGGESLVITTKMLRNEDGEIYTTQELSLYSYGNIASFHLHGAVITPDMLRQLANELDEAMIKAKAAVD